jgi:hypothetical protein
MTVAPINYLFLIIFIKFIKLVLYLCDILSIKIFFKLSELIFKIVDVVL